MTGSANERSDTGSSDLRVKPATVTAQTAMKLRQAISSGRFQPGERLVESTLCQLMGVSRTSVREALRKLEAEHLVTNVPNVGPSVATIDWSAAEEIYEVRAILEGEAAALCAARATPAIIADIDHALTSFEAAVAEDSPSERVRTTEAFYEAILRGARNEVLSDAVVRLNARVSLLRATSMSRPGRAVQSALELRRIFEEIVNGEENGARRAAREHVKSAASAARRVFVDHAEDVV